MDTKVTDGPNQTNEGAGAGDNGRREKTKKPLTNNDGGEEEGKSNNKRGEKIEAIDGNGDVNGDDGRRETRCHRHRGKEHRGVMCADCMNWGKSDEEIRRRDDGIDQWGGARPLRADELMQRPR